MYYFAFLNVHFLLFSCQFITYYSCKTFFITQKVTNFTFSVSTKHTSHSLFGFSWYFFVEHFIGSLSDINFDASENGFFNSFWNCAVFPYLFCSSDICTYHCTITGFAKCSFYTNHIDKIVTAMKSLLH